MRKTSPNSNGHLCTKISSALGTLLMMTALATLPAGCGGEGLEWDGSPEVTTEAKATTSSTAHLVAATPELHGAISLRDQFDREVRLRGIDPTEQDDFLENSNWCNDETQFVSLFDRDDEAVEVHVPDNSGYPLRDAEIACGQWFKQNSEPSKKADGTLYSSIVCPTCPDGKSGCEVTGIWSGGVKKINGKYYCPGKHEKFEYGAPVYWQCGTCRDSNCPGSDSDRAGNSDDSNDSGRSEDSGDSNDSNDSGSAPEHRNQRS